MRRQDWYFFQKHGSPESQSIITPLQGLPLFYGPNPRRCPGLSYGAPLGLGRRGSFYGVSPLRLGRRGSSNGLSSLDSRPRHTAGAFSKFTRGVSDESFIKVAYTLIVNNLKFFNSSSLLAGLLLRWSGPIEMAVEEVEGAFAIDAMPPGKNFERRSIAEAKLVVEPLHFGELTGDFGTEGH